MATKEFVYYKKNVNYNVGVRRYPGDKDGILLSGQSPIVPVDKETLRDFKMANKDILIKALIVEVAEPNIEWETENAISDEEMVTLVKNYLQLKSRLPKIDSLPILYKLREEAKSQDRAKKIISLIQSRIDELDEGDDDFSRLSASSNPSEMKGVE